MVTWSKQNRCVLSYHAIVPILFLSLKRPLTTGVVISCRILCVLSSRAIVPVLLLSLKFLLTPAVVISCRIRCMLSFYAIVPFLFLSLKFPLTTGVIISCHSYHCCCLDAHYIANHTDLTQTKGLNIPLYFSVYSV